MIFRAAVVLWAAASLSACGPDPLSSLQGGILSVFISRGSAGVGSVTASLQPEEGECPTLAATADLNGSPIPVASNGGKTSGSFYFVPTSGCASPSFAYQSGVDPGRIPAGGSMTLSIKDSSGTVELRSEDALAFTLEPVPAASRRAGDSLTFSITRTLDFVEAPTLSFRREGESDLVRGSAYGFPQLQSGQIVSTIPDAGPGNYAWFAGVSARVAPSGCSGVSVCNPIWVTATTSGSFTVDP